MWNAKTRRAISEMRLPPPHIVAFCVRALVWRRSAHCHTAEVWPGEWQDGWKYTQVQVGCVRWGGGGRGVLRRLLYHQNEKPWEYAIRKARNTALNPALLFLSPPPPPHMLWRSVLGTLVHTHPPT